MRSEMLIELKIPFESFIDLPFYEYGWFIRNLEKKIKERGKENEKTQEKQPSVDSIMRKAQKNIKMPKFPKFPK